jgi:N-acetylglutamate synthase-like GNAT family acetyltransferase
MGVRKANLRDASEVLSVINISNAEAYRKIIPLQYFKEPVFAYEDILEKFKQMDFYVYELEGKIVGVAALEPKGDLANIRFVYVLPEHQRKGVGTSLVKYIEGEAKRFGFRKLRVPYVDMNADWAINFYKKLGYRVVERREKAWGFNLFFEKELE